jgi:hypothetical protein
VLVSIIFLFIFGHFSLLILYVNIFNKRVAKVARKLQESCNEYNCDICQYKTDRKSSYIKHLGTLKHYNSTKSTEKLQKLQGSCEQFICLHCNAKFRESK